MEEEDGEHSRSEESVRESGSRRRKGVGVEAGCTGGGSRGGPRDQPPPPSRAAHSSLVRLAGRRESLAGGVSAM